MLTYYCSIMLHQT